MRVLICTDGSPAAEQAANMIAQLHFPGDTQITLLGVSETEGDQPALSASFGRMEKILAGPYPDLEHKIRRGAPVEQILSEVGEKKYDLATVGARGRHRGLERLRAGSTTHKLARSLRIPILVCRNVPDHLRRILICTAAEAPSTDMLRIGGQLIAASAAEVGLLHVMSQLALRLDSPPDDLLDTAQSAIARRTREGLHLEHATQLLRQAGVDGSIQPRLRHGLVVDEVLAELQEGGYDLIVIGGHYQHHGSRWLELLLEDVTGQLLSRAGCSVLII
jgi:nucleotide-binding universal stress UspA family protein